jgi:hypothetical protein
MIRLRYYIESKLRYDNALGMRKSLDCHVFEDREQFDGLHPYAVREHFAQWAASVPQQEQGESRHSARSQRYDYCIHVDQGAIQSVISQADNLGKGNVNLTCREIFRGMGPEHTAGRDQQDHCWMRIMYQDLMATWYNQFRPQGSWSAEYCIPPEIARP